MTDAELIALAAMVMNEAVQMAGENQLRGHLGESPAYVTGSGGRYASALEIELVGRNIVLEPEEHADADA